MDRRGYLRLTGLVGAVGLTTAVGTESNWGSQGDYETVRVPGEYATVQAGVDAAGHGDLVLVGEGTYTEPVRIMTPGLTLRGRDRNAVVLDGEFGPGNGVHVEADGVAVENLTVRHFQDNAVYWTGVEGFRGSFLTAYNNGYYGLYGYDSTDGRFEYSYASGHPDAGIYLGWNQPFDALVTDCVAEYNALGYSGTSTGEGITIRDSIFRHNMAGIVPNSLVESGPAQRASRIVDNVVSDNGYVEAPVGGYQYGMFGTGIVLWGGTDNVVEDNVVDGHPNYGIALSPSVTEPSGNVVRGNLVSDSGRADLALGAPAGADNRFEDNQFASSAPTGIEADASRGDATVTQVYRAQERRAENAADIGGDWREQPEPGPQPTMRDPEIPPLAADLETSLVE